jgi:hypothetical protein
MLHLSRRPPNPTKSWIHQVHINEHMLLQIKEGKKCHVCFPMLKKGKEKCCSRINAAIFLRKKEA